MYNRLFKVISLALILIIAMSMMAFSTPNNNSSYWETYYCSDEYNVGSRWNDLTTINDLVLVLGNTLDSSANSNYKVSVQKDTNSNEFHQSYFHFEVPKSTTDGSILMEDVDQSVRDISSHENLYIGFSFRLNQPLVSNSYSTLFKSAISVDRADGTSGYELPFSLSRRGDFKVFGNPVSNINEYDYVENWIDIDIFIEGWVASLYINGEILCDIPMAWSGESNFLKGISRIIPFWTVTTPQYDYTIDFADYRIATYDDSYKEDSSYLYKHTHTYIDKFGREIERSLGIPFVCQPFCDIYWDEPIEDYSLIHHDYDELYGRLYLTESVSNNRIFHFNLQTLTPIYPK